MNQRRELAVVFDVDGCLLDSRSGIVAGFRHALMAVGIEPPSDEVLGADLGPPVGQVMLDFGVPAERTAEARGAYRAFYRREGLQQSIPYVGVVELLSELTAGGVRLGTATAKRSDTAAAILTHHGLADFFTVINGSTDEHPTKTETLTETLRLLDPAPEAELWMIGDRHSDIAAGQACGTRTVGAMWGYGSVDELTACGPDLLADSPADPRLWQALRLHTRPASR